MKWKKFQVMNIAGANGTKVNALSLGAMATAVISRRLIYPTAEELELE